MEVPAQAEIVSSVLHDLLGTVDQTIAATSLKWPVLEAIYEDSWAKLRPVYLKSRTEPAQLSPEDSLLFQREEAAWDELLLAREEQNQSKLQKEILAQVTQSIQSISRCPRDVSSASLDAVESRLEQIFNVEEAKWRLLRAEWTVLRTLLEFGEQH